MENALADIQQLREHSERVGRVLKHLANSDRLLLLCQLSQGECHVSALEQLTGIRQPTLSQQLAVLRRGGLTQARRQGKQMYYQISCPKVLQLMQTLYDLYCREQE